MESNGTSIFVVIFLAVLILSAVLIVWMFVSLVRSELEDERRQMIVGKASTWAFIAVVGGDLIEVIRTAVQQPSGEPASPFIQLVTAAVVYAAFWAGSSTSTEAEHGEQDPGAEERDGPLSGRAGPPVRSVPPDHQRHRKQQVRPHPHPGLPPGRSAGDHGGRAVPGAGGKILLKLAGTRLQNGSPLLSLF